MKCVKTVENMLSMALNKIVCNHLHNKQMFKIVARLINYSSNWAFNFIFWKFYSALSRMNHEMALHRSFKLNDCVDKSIHKSDIMITNINN